MVDYRARGEGCELAVSHTDTICAIATPPGMGGVGIVRISGPDVRTLARLTLKKDLKPRYATLSAFLDEEGGLLDEGIALFFPGPQSFTGEDVLELQGHGSPVVLDRLLQALVAHGARLARPGEFTERAFLNGKIDLIQAEAVADLIESAHEASARAALNTLQGAFSTTIKGLQTRLSTLRVHVEADLDFPEESLAIENDHALEASLQALRRDVKEARRLGREGRLLREGAQVVIAGAPNAGKSTLLNALCGHEAAIVHAKPGTTRDLVRERIMIEGLALELTDTAGLRESLDPVEAEGIRRARGLLDKADCVLWLVDDGAPRATLVFENPVPTLIVFTKIDTTGRAPGAHEDGLAVSALTGAGLAPLRQAIRATILGGADAGPEGSFTARRRHVVALDRIDLTLAEALLRQGEGSPELVAEELRRAQEYLGEMTGEFTSDDLLGQIFADFCIGK